MNQFRVAFSLSTLLVGLAAGITTASRGDTTTSTANTVAKYVDGSGTLGESAIVESEGVVSFPGWLRLGNAPATYAQLFAKSTSNRTPIAWQSQDAGAATGYLYGDIQYTGLITTPGALELTSAAVLVDAANSVGLYTSGTNRLNVTSTGNVGIGTLYPNRDSWGAIRKVVTIESTTGGGGGVVELVGNNLSDQGVVGAVDFVQNIAGTFTQMGAIYAYRDGAANSARLNFFTGHAGAVTSKMTILSDGNVGIGTSTPSAKLHVAGDVTVTGNIAAKYQDVAEWVEAPPLEAGTVVIVDPLKPNQVVASSASYDTRVAGAVSAQPGLILGDKSDSKEMIAQSGRVKVKVDATRGAIRIGDLLVTSPTPGHAMRSRPLEVSGETMHRPGTILGKALEALPSGKGEILVLLTLQ
jgi:hypothetical protein